jgi:hypothetical protein
MDRTGRPVFVGPRTVGGTLMVVIAMDEPDFVVTVYEEEFG